MSEIVHFPRNFILAFHDIVSADDNWNREASTASKSELEGIKYTTHGPTRKNDFDSSFIYEIDSEIVLKSYKSNKELTSSSSGNFKHFRTIPCSLKIHLYFRWVNVFAISETLNKLRRNVLLRERADQMSNQCDYNGIRL